MDLLSYPSIVEPSFFTSTYPKVEFAVFSYIHLTKKWPILHIYLQFKEMLG